jgi:hypothetical protein
VVRGQRNLPGQLLGRWNVRGMMRINIWGAKDRSNLARVVDAPR